MVMATVTEDHHHQVRPVVLLERFCLGLLHQDPVVLVGAQVGVADPVGVVHTEDPVDSEVRTEDQVDLGDMEVLEDTVAVDSEDTVAADMAVAVVDTKILPE